MYAALRRAAPLRRRAVSALAAALLQQQPAAMGAVVPRLPGPAAATAAWFHSSPAWLGFRETGPAGAAARAEFAAAEEGSFYEEEKRAAGAGGAAAEGLEIAKLGISSKIVDRLAKKGITKLFPIQRAVLEPAMQGKDMVGRAKTGTGKTLAFGIPIMDAIIRHNDKYKPGKLPLAIVLAPTRELAKQVEREFIDSSPLETLCVYGGTPISQQIRQLNYGVDVVIGTPGRVIDLLKRGSLSLAEIRFVVLDEADQMLSVGFDQDVETILQQVPQQRQTLMFSATMPTWIRKLTQKYLNNPVTVDLVGEDDQKLAEGISLFSIASENREKPAVLGELIKEHAKGGKCIVFTQTKRDADRLSYSMSRSFQCEALHGDISQAQRERTLAGFRDGRFNILIATDVAARGLDIPNVDLVIHFELPNSSEIFVHRSGRTGRAGKKGTAIVMYNYRQSREVQGIERDVGSKFKELPKINVEGSELLGGDFDSFGGGGGGELTYIHGAITNRIKGDCGARVGIARTLLRESVEATVEVWTTNSGGHDSGLDLSITGFVGRITQEIKIFRGTIGDLCDAKRFVVAVGEDDQKLAEGISLFSIASENREKPAILGELIKLKWIGFVLSVCHCNSNPSPVEYAR
ncbi:hypothetical protein C2845_PM06G33600 [Panicum miliaceum]|uniref:DEAD-box ATP-dependent RNA helicase 53-like n=1 Tax=Panicum miliaceum TaxID=4540 RepID=A0A3L6RCB8_PANMI|nr:hypothetical protein C2845_PM06G33600 [Panicum miliaceum]